MRLDRRALGRALTNAANASLREVLASDSERSTNQAYRIGITGAPGAGKSTLVGRLAVLRSVHRKLGVLAIDPSSPRSGGALLGDRIRMDDVDGAAELFIRSLASRTRGDGLADNLPELLDVIDRFGFDEVLLETVGVGQAEHQVRTQVDTLVLVLVPQAGDAIQAMKAGLLELADIFVVNKSDLPGADAMASELARVLNMSAPVQSGWSTPVLLTRHDAPDSIERLSSSIEAHRAFVGEQALAVQIRAQRARYRLRSLLARMTDAVVDGFTAEQLARPIGDQVERAANEIRTQLALQTCPPSGAAPD